jgi:hypothetical protein
VHYAEVEQRDFAWVGRRGWGRVQQCREHQETS